MSQIRSKTPCIGYILSDKRNATVKFCHVLHATHKHEHDLNLESGLGVILICRFCLPLCWQINM